MEFYPGIKTVHVVSVLASGGLFMLRGLVLLGGRPQLAMAAPVRYLSYWIDSALLAAGLVLVSILPRGIFANGWLAAKLALLVVYILLGSFALKRGKTPRQRRVCYLFALAVFGFMLGIARSHHPLGPFAQWFG